MGLLIVENALKDDTKKIMEELIECNYKVKIISGDSPLTAIHTAIKAKMMEKCHPTLIIDVRGEEQG